MFAEIAGLDVELRSIRQDRPPAPDITCTVDGQRVCFELGRVAHPAVVQNLVETARSAASSPQGVAHGGSLVTFVSEPWEALLSGKARASSPW